jgi:hypothetical protein
MRLLFSLIICGIFFSCNSKDYPDVSNVKIPLETKRFDKAIFAMDTNNISVQMEKLVQEYPFFVPNYIESILGADPKWGAEERTSYLKSFISYNRTVYDTAQKYFSDFSGFEKEVKHGLQFVKYYFPSYKVPSKIITYIGPADGYGDILDEDAFIVGLQAHLGKDFPLYKTDMVREVYPDYITARFSPDYITVNCMRNIVNDMYPEKNEDKRLIIQMVEKGKRLWLLSKFLPETDEYKLMGYTKAQMKDCNDHQANIWSMFLQNNFLQTADNNLIKNYVSEGPKTQELGEGAPGNIGSYAGWQIVKKYVSKNPEVKPSELMALDDEKIYVEAKYKP